MPSITLRDLSETLDIQTIHEETRTRFETQQRRRRSVNDWTITLMPFFVLLAALTFYLLSAPHTVGLLNWITPGWGWVSPVGIELFIVAISAVHQHGWKTLETKIMIYGLMLTAIIVNVFGGMLSVISQAGDTFKGLTFSGIIERFQLLEAKWQIVFILTPIIGFLIPVAGKFAGSFVMKMAKGEIKFQIVSVEELWMKERATQLKSAFMNAAMKAGAGPKTAGAWAQRVIEEMFEISDDVEAVGQSMNLSGDTLSPVISSISQRPMGFSTGIQVQKDTQEQPEVPGQRFSIRSADVIRWVDKNDDRVKEMLNQPDNRRSISKAISREIIGVESGYKTVERILKEKGYNF